MLNLISRMITAMAATTMLAACAYQGGDIGDPLTRKFHWFSFVEGEDIRAACAPGTPDRYRLVYNGIYLEQLRIYETDAIRRILVARVVPQGNAGALSASDLAGPWRAQESREPLAGGEYDALVESFARSGMFAPPPVGLELPSRSYYWTAAYCRDGAFGFTAWKHPSPRFDQLTFPQMLLAKDKTGVAMNQARPVPVDPQYEDAARKLQVPAFTLKVGKTGLSP